MDKESEQIELSFGDIYKQVDTSQSATELALGPVLKAAEICLKTKKHIAIAIAGGSASGKTAFFAPSFAHQFDSVLVVHEDDYCVGNSVSAKRNNGTPNLHIPEDFDPDLLAKHLIALKQGQTIDKPVYSYEIRERVDYIRVKAAQVIVAEGTFLLHPPLVDKFEVRAFINTDDHSRFIRRMIRQRRNPNQTDWERINEYFQYSFPLYYSNIHTTQSNADIVIHNNYSPEEGKNRIENYESGIVLLGENIESVIRSLTPVGKDEFVRCYYTHPQCRDCELTYVVCNSSSANRFRYSPGVVSDKLYNKRPFIDLNLEGETIDLEDIGYTQTAQYKGSELYLRTPDGANVTYVTVDGDRSAVYILEEDSNISHTCFLKEELQQKGLTVADVSFDEWILRPF